MREFNVVNINGVDRGPRIVPAKVFLDGSPSYISESIITKIPAGFTGGRIEGTNNSFNGRLVWKPKKAQNTDNSS